MSTYYMLINSKEVLEHKLDEFYNALIPVCKYRPAKLTLNKEDLYIKVEFEQPSTLKTLQDRIMKTGVSHCLKIIEHSNSYNGGLDPTESAALDQFRRKRHASSEMVISATKEDPKKKKTFSY